MNRWIKTAWYVLTLRCEEADRLRCAPSASDVSAAARFGERVHSALCGSCRGARRRLALLNDALASLREDAQAPPGPPASPASPASTEMRGERLGEAARERLLRSIVACRD